MGKVPVARRLAYIHGGGAARYPYQRLCAAICSSCCWRPPSSSLPEKAGGCQRAAAFKHWHAMLAALQEAALLMICYAGYKRRQALADSYIHSGKAEGCLAISEAMGAKARRLYIALQRGSC